MKNVTLLCATLVLLFCFSLLSRDVVMAKEQTICPLMGGQIDKKVYTDHKDKRVYFCCAGCINSFKKDPEKYVKKMEEEGIELAKAPVTPEKKDDHAGHNH